MNIDINSTAYKAFCKKCVTEKGIIGKEEMSATFEKILKVIPEDILPTLGATAEEQVLNFWDGYWRAIDGGNNTGDTPKTQTPATGKSTRVQAVEFTPPAGPEVRSGMESLVMSDFARRQQISDVSGITHLLKRFPDHTAFLTGKKVIPVMSQKAIAKYTEDLVDTADNKAAFEAVLEAINGATLIDVDPEDKNVRIEGVKVLRPGVGQSETSMTTEIYSNSELMAFLIADTTLRLGTQQSPIGVGAKYKKFSTVDSKGRASTDANYGKPVMTLVGKKQALENHPEAIEVISAVDEVAPTEKKKVRTKLSFKIHTGDPDSTGKRKEKTVRVNGWLDNFPNYTILPEYEAHFKATQRNVVSTQLTDAEKEETTNILTNLSIAAANDQIVGVSKAAFGTDFIQKVKENAEAAKAADTKKAADTVKSAK